MQIGSLFDNRLNKNISYSYCEPGMDKPLLPDLDKEANERDVYTSHDGNLFYNTDVSWKKATLLIGGVDIKVKADTTCFIDYVNIIQQKDSYIEKAEIFTIEENGNYKKIGEYIPRAELDYAPKYMPTKYNFTSELEFSIPVGYYCDNVVVRLNSNCYDLGLQKLDIWAAWDLEDSVFPIPQKALFDKKSYALKNLKTVSAKSEEELFAAAYLNEKLSHKFGHTLNIVSENGDVSISTINGEKEEFRIISKDSKASICGADRAGILYGVDAFLQLIDKDIVKNAEIKNVDFKEMRAVHIGLPTKKDVEFFKNLVKHVLVPMHYNMVFIQLTATMRFKKHPELNDNWLKICQLVEEGKITGFPHYDFMCHEVWEQEEVRELLDFMESYGLEVIPEIQAFGHTQYITSVYPDMAEQPENNQRKLLDVGAAEIPPDATFSGICCSKHPNYYPLFFDLIDEVIEVFKPKRFLHMGHDEFLGFGECKICNKFPKRQIIKEEISTFNEYVKSKGLTMMIWDDMFQKDFFDYACPSAINDIPTDIIVLNFVWYFDMGNDTEDNLLDHGLKVMIGNMYSSHYKRYESRIRKDGMVGGEVSTWTFCNEERLGFLGKIYDFFYSSVLLCSESYKKEFRLIYNELIKPIIKDFRYIVADLNTDKPDRNLALGGNINNVPYDIRGIVEYNDAVSLSVNNQEKEISVNDYADIINIVHATDIPAKRILWKDPYYIAEYVINFEDGSEYCEKIGYAYNIHQYHSFYGDPALAGVYNHQGYIGTYFTIPENGKTYEGKEYTLGKYSFRNPNPEKKIKSITLKHLKTAGAKVMIFDITLN